MSAPARQPQPAKQPQQTQPPIQNRPASKPATPAQMESNLAEYRRRMADRYSEQHQEAESTPHHSLPPAATSTAFAPVVAPPPPPTIPHQLYPILPPAHPPGAESSTTVLPGPAQQYMDQLRSDEEFARRLAREDDELRRRQEEHRPDTSKDEEYARKLQAELDQADVPPPPPPPMINDQPEAPLSPAYLHADEYGSQSETREQDLGDGARMVTTTTHRPGFVSSTTTEIHPGGSFYSSITSSSSSRLDDVPPVAPRRSPMPPMPQYVAPSVPAPAGEAQQPMGVWPLRSLRQMMDLLGQDFDDPEMSAQLASRLHPMRAYGGPFEGIQGGALPRYDEMRGGRDGMTLGSMDLMGGMPMMVPMMALLGGMGGMGGGVQPSYEPIHICPPVCWSPSQDLIRLGDRIGPAVPQNASREEIEQLPTTKFHPGSLPKDKATQDLRDRSPG
ncbi:hypothetical protein PAPYR_628 [Paratrimastix pyriformis]|uniref:Uncharacterized protein n=1 Tax=Paratrimastix pyriformis TaxID=342808 RepID=A0ABQ8UW23_9EUKA|nr:hypothetical protein PAPYR_628 [Paratrimastix pyriformis]